MTNEETYRNLVELSERLGVIVSLQNLSKPGSKARSGMCRIRDKAHIILDKTRPLKEKVEVLIECLRQIPHDHIYIVPAVREMIDPGSGETSPENDEGASAGAAESEKESGIQKS